MDIEGDASEVSSRNACCSPGANAVLITYKRRRTGISATTRMPYFLFLFPGPLSFLLLLMLIPAFHEGSLSIRDIPEALSSS